MSWRNNIAQIAEQKTGEPTSQSWQSNFITIANTRGHSPTSWREAIRMVASDFGISPSGWRSELADIAEVLGSTRRLSWREAIAFIANNLSGDTAPPPMPPQGLFFITMDGFRLLTSNNNLFLVR